MGSVNSAQGTSPTATTAQLTQAAGIYAAAGVLTAPTVTAPADNPKIAQDLSVIAAARAQLAVALGTATVDPAAVSQAQSNYDQAVTGTKGDLNNAGIVGSDGDWVKNFLSNYDKDMPQPLFAGSDTAQSNLTRVDGAQVTKPDPTEGITDVPPGYVAPPDIPANATSAQIGQIVSGDENGNGGLSDAQANFIGWALAQQGQGKQVTVPPGDARAWNTVANYELANNRNLNTGNPVEDDGAAPNLDSDQVVEGGLFHSTPQDVGSIVEQAVVGAGTALLGFGPIGELVSGATSAVKVALTAADAADSDASAAASAATSSADAATAAGSSADSAASSANAADSAAQATPFASDDAGATAALQQQANEVGGLFTTTDPLANQAVGKATPRAAPSAATAAAEKSPLGNTDYLSDAAANPALPTKDLDGVSVQQGTFTKGAWGPSGSTINDVQQAAIGTCQTNAALLGLEARGSAASDLLESSGGGDYVLHGFNPKTGAPTDVALDSTLPVNSAGNPITVGPEAQGIGGGLLVKGVAKLQDFAGAANGSSGYDGAIGMLGSQVARSILPQSAIQANKTILIGTGKLADVFDSADKPVQGLTDIGSPTAYQTAQTQLAQNLASGDKNFSTLSFSNQTDPTAAAFLKANNLQQGHAFTVLNYDKATDDITLLDPNYGTGSAVQVKVKLQDVFNKNLNAALYA